MNRLLYFVDPMCSWCYGFAPEMAKLRAHYGSDLPIDVITGGLRAGERRPMTAAVREQIQHHWRQVAEVSGQPFRFDGALPDGFVYDTEPACRALVVARRLDASAVFALLEAIHSAFYADSEDVTDAAVLAAIAVANGLDEQAFNSAFHDPHTQTETAADFEVARDHGVMGFPALLLDTGERKRMIAMGYQKFEHMQPVLDARMAG